MTRGKAKNKPSRPKARPKPATRCRRRHVFIPLTLRAALDRIGEMLAQEDYGADLWAVLTALRGPDLQTNSTKYATTAVIRDAAFPKRETVNGSVFRKDNAVSLARRKELFAPQPGAFRPMESSHFLSHVSEAFTALGLDLLSCNAEAVLDETPGPRQK